MLQLIRNAGDGPSCVQNTSVAGMTAFESDLNTVADIHTQDVS